MEQHASSCSQIQHLFQRVVKTVEGVKGDTVFCYWPPLNLFAFILFAPLSWVCSSRTLHRINVFAIRATVSPNMVFSRERPDVHPRHSPSSLLFRHMSAHNTA